MPRDWAKEKFEYRRSVWDKTDGHCAYCGRHLPFDSDWHIEHMIPRPAPGSNVPSNLVPSCRTCNIKKGSRRPAGFKVWILNRFRKDWNYRMSPHFEHCLPMFEPATHQRIVEIMQELDDLMTPRNLEFYYETLKED